MSGFCAEKVLRLHILDEIVVRVIYNMSANMEWALQGYNSTYTKSDSDGHDFHDPSGYRPGKHKVSAEVKKLIETKLKEAKAPKNLHVTVITVPEDIKYNCYVGVGVASAQKMRYRAAFQATVEAKARMEKQMRLKAAAAKRAAPPQSREGSTKRRTSR